MGKRRRKGKETERSRLKRGEGSVVVGDLLQVTKKRLEGRGEKRREGFASTCEK